MLKKLYKRKYTSEDLALVENLIKSKMEKLYIEMWVDNSDDSAVYEITPKNLSDAINICSKYYDNVNAITKCVELIGKESDGIYTTIYHIERNREGLTYEIINYAKGLNKNKKGC